MRTGDEIAAKYSQLVEVRDTKEVKVWTDTIRELIDMLTMQYVNEKGEEAVRALGVLKGLNMALTLDIIYKASLPTPQIERVQKILRP
jgi:tetrahydromethanopterin S-methyltransferase subunit G